jgi:TPR repeat protein
MTMDENENKQVFDEKSGSEKNLTVPILVVAMLTALAVWFVPNDEEDIDLKKPLPQLDSVIQPLGTEGSDLPPLDTGSAIRPLDEIETESSEDTAEPSDNSVASKPRKEDGDDVRVLIAQLRKEGADSSQKAYEEAEKRRRVGDNESAYLLYFFAARHGHGDAALVLGTMADPNYYTTVTSALTAPDYAQAIKWYKKAINAGNKDAKKNLADLTRRIKKQAEAGSSEAQRLLLQL